MISNVLFVLICSRSHRKRIKYETATARRLWNVPDELDMVDALGQDRQIDLNFVRATSSIQFAVRVSAFVAALRGNAGKDR
jgi:predicted transcriptional regulator